MSLVELAEAPSLHARLAPGEELVVTDAYVLFLGRDDHPGATVVQRLRLAPESVSDTVEEVREAVRRRGRSNLAWEVSDAATPSGLAERLLRLGAVPAGPPSEPRATLMALRAPPAPGPPGVEVMRVETVEAFHLYVSITHEVFGLEDRLPAELERIEREGARDLADQGFVRYVASIGGRAVAAGSATFAAAGVVLHAGCTRVEARGRGAYRALVAARWEEAARRGTPAAVTRAGAMSAPLLRRLGFAEIGALQLLHDPLHR
ncbi:MAG TPA: hypothetical protein VFR63_08835 [Gaiellaceae bacterium]|nr:hypothetical protein [Gaiellaceae bacterium]